MNLIYFSPTSTGRTVATEIARPWADAIVDINLCHKSLTPLVLNENDIAIIIVPVYSGRIPLEAELSLRKIKGQNTPAITVVMYGNRDYDDALLELNNVSVEQGFNIVASAAFIGTHSLDESIAHNRPNFKDLISAFNLGITVKANLEEFKKREIKVKGNYPYKERKKFPYYPVADDKCDECSICAQTCPMEAIPKDNLKTSDPSLCISCMLCARVCPQDARQLNMPPEQLEQFQLALREKCSGEKTPELIY